MSAAAASFDELEQVANKIAAKVTCRPVIGIVCGSGLGLLAEQVTNKEIIPYDEIPCFPKRTHKVKGHSNQLVFGEISGKQVVLMQGRLHFYEGIPVSLAAQPPRLLKFLGVKILVITNAAGGLNRDYNVGDFMLIKDHINLPGMAGFNPLMGFNDERWGPRFQSTSDLYSLRLSKLVHKAAENCNLTKYLHEGVYCFESGPTFESIAECNYLLKMGADAVGMSTVPEAIVAHHCGLEVCAISLITNRAVLEYGSAEKANHEEVLQTGKVRAHDMLKLVTEMLTLL